MSMFPFSFLFACWACFSGFFCFFCGFFTPFAFCFFCFVGDFLSLCGSFAFVLSFLYPFLAFLRPPGPGPLSLGGTSIPDDSEHACRTPIDGLCCDPQNKKIRSRNTKMSYDVAIDWRDKNAKG